MNIYNRIIQGIRHIGLKRTIKISFISLMDYVFDFTYGTDTVNQVELDNLYIQSKNRTRGERYALSPAKAFNKLMNTLSFPHNSVFVDLGCGKGKMLLMASQYGFKRIVGVEFSEKLCECARNNISIYKKKTGMSADIDVVFSDVVDYKIKDDENLFYLFNPFDEDILINVLRNIAVSFERKHREIYFIYYCPFHGKIIEQEKHFVRSERHIVYGCEFEVYVYAA
jgi:SAM-dependent methyltransferase